MRDAEPILRVTSFLQVRSWKAPRYTSLHIAPAECCPILDTCLQLMFRQLHTRILEHCCTHALTMNVKWYDIIFKFNNYDLIAVI